MIIEEFTALMTEFTDKYPGYEVVICNCVECLGMGNPREDNWAVNHAEKKIYL